MGEYTIQLLDSVLDDDQNNTTFKNLIQKDGLHPLFDFCEKHEYAQMLKQIKYE
jgi:hypothetical protein